MARREPTTPPLGGNGTVDFGFARAAKWYPDIPALRGQDMSQVNSEDRAAVFSVNGGGPGYYFYDPDSTDPADGSNIISPDNGAGRWIRDTNVRQTGVKINSISDLEGDVPGTIELMFNDTPERKVMGFASANDGGAGHVAWDASISRQQHDGGRIISPTWDNGAYANGIDSNWLSPDPGDNGTGCWVRDESSYKPEHYGVLGINRIYDTAAFKSLLTNNEDVYLSDHYYLNAISVQGQGINLHGNGGAVLDFTGDTSNDEDLAISGSTEPMPGLASNVSKGDDEITFSAAHGLGTGDLFIIYSQTDFSFSYHRAYYRAGEICKVKEVTGSNSVVIYRNHSTGLFDGYTASDVNIYKINPVKVTASGFRLEGNQGRGLMVQYAEAVNLSNVDFRGSFQTTLSTDCCYGVTIDGVSISHDAGFSNGYGIVYAGTQNIIISDCNLRTFGDCLESGRARDYFIPSRNIRISDVFANRAISQHGNVEHTIYDNCKSETSIFLGANNGKMVNCECHQAWTREVLGGNFSFIDSTIRHPSNGQALRMAQTNANITDTQTTVVRGCHFEGYIEMLTGGDKPFDTRLFFEGNTVIRSKDEDPGSDTYGYHPGISINFSAPLDVSELYYRNNTIYGYEHISLRGTGSGGFAEISGNVNIRSTQANIIYGDNSLEGGHIIVYENNKVIDNLRDGGATSLNTNVFFRFINKLFIENNKLGDTVANGSGDWIALSDVSDIYMTNNSNLNQPTNQLVGNAIGSVRPSQTGRGHDLAGIATIPSGQNSVQVDIRTISVTEIITLQGEHEETASLIVPSRGPNGFTIQTSDGSNVTADRQVYWVLQN